MAVAELSDALIGWRSSKRDKIYLFEPFEVLNISGGLDNRTTPLLWIYRPQSVHKQKNGKDLNMCQFIMVLCVRQFKFERMNARFWDCEATPLFRVN